MIMNKAEDIWALILAAGKGKRLNSRGKNKVTLDLAGVPILTRTIRNIRKSKIRNIMVVVGYAKDSVTKILDPSIHTVVQQKRLGTGHAVKVALEKIPPTKNILILYGDDSYLYNANILQNLYKTHMLSEATVTFLTLEVKNPTGLGRIIRDKKNNVTGIVEERDASPMQKKIKEINPACYIFTYDFLKKNISKIPKSPVSGEYYLTYLIELAVRKGVKIETVMVKNLTWRGINTIEELQEAEKLVRRVNS